MILTLDSQLETTLRQEAARRGMSLESLAVLLLRERMAVVLVPDKPRDEWERRLRAIAGAYGVSVPDEALSSEGLYDS